MAGYFTIDGDDLFYRPEVEGLSDAAHRLHDFCLFGPGRSMLGVRRFTPQDVLPRFKGWDARGAEAALAELEAAGLVVYDRGVRLLLARLTLEHAPLRGANSVKGAGRRLPEFPDSPVLIPVMEHILAEAEAAKKAAMKGTGKGPNDKLANELQDLQEAVKDRLQELRRRAPQPPAEGVRTPLTPPPKGVRRGLGTHPKILGVKKSSPKIEAPPKGVWTPSQGGMEGVRRGCRVCPSRARAPNP